MNQHYSNLCDCIKRSIRVYIFIFDGLLFSIKVYARPWEMYTGVIACIRHLQYSLSPRSYTGFTCYPVHSTQLGVYMEI